MRVAHGCNLALAVDNDFEVGASRPILYLLSQIFTTVHYGYV